MSTQLYGAKPLEFSTYRGVNFDVSAAELDPSFASDCQDVIFDGDSLKVRGGRSLYNTTSPINSRVRAISAHYPSSGTRSIVMHAGTAWYADTDNNGSFDQTIESGLTGGVPADLFQWRNWHYLGNSADGMRKWTGSGAGAAVAMLAAPTVNPILQVQQTVIHNFDSNSGSAWTISSGTALTRANNSAKKLEGTNCLQLSATSASAEGINITKDWSAGTQDLSGATEVWVSVFSNQINNSFKIGVADNSGTVDFDLFPAYTITKKETWQTVRVPLAAIPPESRTASTGLGIEWINAPNYSANRVVYFDRALAVGPLSPGDYKYFVTYADVDSNGLVVNESNPGTTINSASTPQVTLQGPKGDVGSEDEILPALGINVVVPTTTTSDVDSIRVYRYLTSGNFRYPRLVKTLAKTTDWTGASTTTAEAVSAAETDIDLTSATSFAINDYAIMGGLEVVKITNIVTNTVTVTRAQYGTVDQAHNSGVSFVKAVVFTDTKDDGSIAVEDSDPLVTDTRISPPKAAAWAIVNNRVLAGNATVSATTYPQRVYLSEFEYPERFASAQLPDFPASAGYFELSGGDPIRRILEFDGQAVIFTDRAIWSLDGSGWDDFTLRKRVDVGLDARNAVVAHDRLIYFLSQDGVRVLAPNHSQDGVWECWVISEPVQSKLRAIPYAYRAECAAGIDERDCITFSIIRSGQTLPDRELVFNPREPGALSPGENKQRPGWTFHARGHGCYYRLKRGDPDAGQLLAGDTTAAFVYYLNRNGSDTALTTDITGSHASSSSTASISWYWQGAATDAGPGGTVELVYADVLADASVGTTTTLAEDLDASETAVDVADGTVTFIGGYVQVDSELLAVTNISTNTLTVTRGVGGTEATTHSNGATVTPVSVYTATPILNGAASSTPQLLNLGTTSTGLRTVHRRLGTDNRAQYVQMKLSGASRTAQAIRSLRVGAHTR